MNETRTFEEICQDRWIRISEERAEKERNKKGFEELLERSKKN